MTRPNVFDETLERIYDERDPEGFRCAEIPFGEAAGGKELAVRMYELPPGQALCPYHYEYVEEWLMVMTGEVQVRTPSGIDPARAGDLVCFPSGPEGVHMVRNDSDAPARVVMFSSGATPAVCVYPESDKVSLWTGNEQDRWRFRGADAHLDYYDGEPSAQQ